MPNTIDELADVAAWYNQLIATNNRAFIPLFEDDHRYLVLKGGGGSGKSIFAGRKILERATTEPGHRFLVCRKVARTLRESCFRQLIMQAYDYYPYSGIKVNKSDMTISFANGSEILFAGLDDPEKLKSIYNITGIWIEEASEVLEGDFNQLDIRLRGETQFYKQIILSFNPISITHWLKGRFFDNPPADALVHESTYKDNRFLDEEGRKVLEAFKDTDEYYYSVYCLGEWGVTGKTVFDAKAITRRLAEKIQPKHIGYFEYDDDGRQLSNIRWVDDANGFIKIYAEPKQGYPYVIGGDTAGGDGGSDSFVAQVIDNTTGEQVCTMRHQTDEDLYARQIYCLGMYYNTALVAIEVNFSTYPVMELQRLRYPKQYVRETIDDYTQKPKSSFGFRTDSRTRPVIIAGLVKAARDVSILLDKTTMEEMLTFIRNEDFRAEAEAGAHDDCVMALAIAHYVRPHQSYLVKEAAVDVKWSESMWEDYRNASPADKKMLIERWGKPKR